MSSTRRTPESASSVMPESLRSMTRPPSSSRMRGESVSRTARGCSWISFIMKCSKPSFSAAAASQRISTNGFSSSSPSML